MTTVSMLDILFPGEAYFGGRTCGFQGIGARHLLMLTTISTLTARNRPINVLEIGSWVGASASTWAQGIAAYSPAGGGILCIDPWRSYFTTADVEDSVICRIMDGMLRSGLAYDLFRHNAAAISTKTGIAIDHHRGTLKDYADINGGKKFDIIYIDGSHYYEDAKSDIAIATGLIEDGGIICGDDLEVQRNESNEDMLRRHMSSDYIDDPELGPPFHPGVSLAVGECFGHVSSILGYWWIQRQGDRFAEPRLTNKRLFIPSHFTPAVRQESEAVCAHLGWPLFPAPPLE